MAKRGDFNKTQWTSLRACVFMIFESHFHPIVDECRKAMTTAHRQLRLMQKTARQNRIERAMLFDRIETLERRVKEIESTPVDKTAPKLHHG